MATFHKTFKQDNDADPAKGITSSYQRESTLRYKALALRTLSARITHSPRITEADILCITVFLFTESLAGDQVAVKAHFEGLTRLIRAYGGPDRLSPIITTHIQLASFMAAQAQQTVPIAPLPTTFKHRFDRISATTFHSNDSSLLRMGSTFLSPLCHELCHRLRKCLRYMRHVLVWIEHVHANTKILESEWIETLVILTHTLISLPHEHEHEHHYPLTKLEESVRLALLLYCDTALWRFSPWISWVKSVVTALREAVCSCLLSPLSSPSVAHLELRLWILVLSLQACEPGLVGEEGRMRMWWVEHIRLTAMQLGVREWSEARYVFRGFFYVERVCGGWEAAWREAMEKGEV